MDAYRDGDSFVVHFDLPGVDPDSIDLSVDRDELTVRAERRWGFEGRELVARERPQGTFSRTLFLGESLDADRIEADYDRGVLTLRIPVTEEAKARKIQVDGQAALTSWIPAGRPTARVGGGVVRLPAPATGAAALD